jgi:hypothetical protein
MLAARWCGGGVDGVVTWPATRKVDGGARMAVGGGVPGVLGLGRGVNDMWRVAVVQLVAASSPRWSSIGGERRTEATRWRWL